MSFHRGERTSDYAKTIQQQEYVVELSTAQIEAIEAKSDSKVLEYSDFDKYPIYKQAYDYVAGRFPTCADQVKSLPLLECSRKTLKLTGSALGVDMAAGFYIPSIDAMVVSRSDVEPVVRAFSHEHRLYLKLQKMQETSDPPIDVILVHELLHFIYKIKHGNGPTISRIANENFAYTETIPYLRECGWTDEEIARQYLNVWAHMMVFGDGKFLEERFEEYGTSKAKYTVMEQKHQMQLMVDILTDYRDHMKNAIYEYAMNMIIDFDVRYGNITIENKTVEDRASSEPDPKLEIEL